MYGTIKTYSYIYSAAAHVRCGQETKKNISHIVRSDLREKDPLLKESKMKMQTQLRENYT